jgi:iron complex outermembrane receptor protein
VGFDYQLTKATMVYVASRRGFRAGGVNGYNSTVGVFEPNYGPETVTDGEIGIKSDFKIGSIPFRIDADVYDQDYNNIQVNNQTILGSGIPVNVEANAAKARITGAEVELTAQLTENFTLEASYDCLDFQYVEFGSGVVGPTTLNQQRFIERPPAKYGVEGRYRLPFGAKVGELALHAGWHWQAQEGDESEPFGMIPAYGVLNFSLDWYKVAGLPVDISLFCSNALDKDYAVYRRTVYTSAVGIAFSKFGDPRMYGARVSYRF